MALQLVQQQSMTLNQDALNDWCAYREFKKKPLSQFAMDRTVKMLEKYDHDHQMYIVDTAIQNDWQGLHPVEPPKTKPTITGDTDWLSTTENR